MIRSTPLPLYLYQNEVSSCFRSVCTFICYYTGPFTILPSYTAHVFLLFLYTGPISPSRGNLSIENYTLNIQPVPKRSFSSLLSWGPLPLCTFWYRLKVSYHITSFKCNWYNRCYRFRVLRPSRSSAHHHVQYDSVKLN